MRTLRLTRKCSNSWQKKISNVSLQPKQSCVIGTSPSHPPEICNPGQLYTVSGELHPIAYTLMKRRNRAAYVKLFVALKVRVLAAVGQLGTLQNSATRLFDLETATIKAAVNTFSADTLLQPITIYSCAFQFAKAIKEKRCARSARKILT